MIIDMHCHYVFTRRFAVAGERFSFEPAVAPDGPAVDACLAPRLTRGVGWRLWKWMLGFDQRLRPGAPADEALEGWYARHLRSAAGPERFVLLAFDRYHDDAGRRPPFPERSKQRGSDMYTSNSLVRAACRAHPQRFLFGASVHPYREDAVACIDEVFAAGACLLKWIPLHQNINVRDPRTLAVLRRCAELGLPLLVHCGPEFSLATQHPEYERVGPLLDVLRELRRESRMPTVIVAHVGTPVTPLGDHASLRLTRAALTGEFADAPLYADISALTAWGKTRYLRQLARCQELHHKLLFGSDFPVPLGLPRLRRDLGAAYRDIAAEPAWPARALRVYRTVGFNEIVFRRAATLLPNVDFFAPRPGGGEGPSLTTGGAAAKLD